MMDNSDQSKAVASKKLTVVGDGGTGKTNLLVSFVENQFQGNHVPTVFDCYSSSIRVDGEEHVMALWDTAGQEGYDRLRVLAYPNTSAFILCFALDSRDAYENVERNWASELQQNVSDAKIILVGTKADLRPPYLSKQSSQPDPQEKFITFKEGNKMKDAIKADRYLECSAKTREGVEEVFHETIRCIIAQGCKKKGRKHRCVLL